MATCFKCNQPVGDEGVQLKNGMYCCPQCYGSPASTSFGQTSNQGPEKSSLPIGGLIALVIIVGGMWFGWKAYSDHQDAERRAEMEKAKAEQMAEQRERDAQAQQIAETKRLAEVARKAQEAADAQAKQQMEVARKQAEAYKASRDAETALAERKRVEDLAVITAQRSANDEARRKDIAAERARQADDAAMKIRDKMAGHIQTIRTYEAAIAEIPAQKQALSKQQVVYRNIQQGAQSKADVNQKMKDGYPLEQRDSAEYRLILGRLKSGEDEARTMGDKLRAVEQQLREKDYEANSLQGRLAEERRRLAAYNPTPAMLAAAEAVLADAAAAAKGGKPVAGTGTKPTVGTAPAATTGAPSAVITPVGRSIVKKDGTVIPVKSFLKANDEYWFKDMDGKSGVIKEDQVQSVNQ